MKGAAVKYRGTEERQDVAHVAEEPPVQVDQPRDMGSNPRRYQANFQDSQRNNHETIVLC